MWQTYDYYFEPTAAYFGIKKASEPLHIQWNPATDNIEVVNYSGGETHRADRATVELLNMDGACSGRRRRRWTAPKTACMAPIKMEYPAGLTPVHFIRLKLTRGSARRLRELLLARNRGRQLSRASRPAEGRSWRPSTRAELEGGRWLLTTELRNASASPALMVRLKAVREKSGDRILPAIYSDNYLALMPGERRTIVTEVKRRRHARRGPAPGCRRL